MIKKCTLGLILTLISFNLSFGQTCPNSHVILTTQEDIDSFPIKYPDCQTIPGNLIIRASNADLRRLGPLSNIRFVEGDVVIEGNSFLSRLLGLENLRIIDGSFIVRQNNVLDDVDELESLVSVGGDFIFEYNADMQNFDGLTRLETVNGDFRLRFNTDLISLAGLSSLTTVGGDLSIRNQNALYNLEGLDNIAPSGLNSITIKDCNTLTVCDVPSVCTYLNGSGATDIENNNAGCSSTMEILNACNNITSTEDFLENNSIVIAPNPTSGSFRVLLNAEGNYDYYITNIIGKRLQAGNITDGDSIDIGNYSKGIYLISFLHGDQKIVRRIVKD